MYLKTWVGKPFSKIEWKGRFIEKCIGSELMLLTNPKWREV